MPSLVALVLLLVAAAPALATTLPEAPLSVVLPSTLSEGRDAIVTVEPRESAGGGVTFDVYVIRIPSRQPVLKYFSSMGIWTLEPAPWQRHRGVTALTSQAATWREDGPAGFVTLLVVFVRAGAGPSERSVWLFEPVLGRVSVRPAATMGSGAALFAGALGLVTLAAGALVVLGVPRRHEVPGARQTA